MYYLRTSVAAGDESVGRKPIAERARQAYSSKHPFHEIQWMRRDGGPEPLDLDPVAWPCPLIYPLPVMKV